MYRFLLTPKWLIFTAVVALAVAGMVRLGFWQYDRLQDRRAFNADVRANDSAPVATLDEVDLSDPDAVEWRRITVTGRYVPDEGVVVVNRSQGGHPGRNVVGVLDLGDGTAILVNRGFLPSLEPDVATPAGEVMITGRLRGDEQRRLGQPSIRSGVDLTEIPRIEVDALQPQIEPTLLPMHLQAIESDPSDAEALQPIAFPGLDNGPHLSYMVQWWVFALCAVIGWVFAVRRSVTDRRRAVLGPSPADDAPTTVPPRTPSTSSH
jgi:cytochrome oxidase assembly protein ShyY1